MPDAVTHGLQVPIDQFPGHLPRCRRHALTVPRRLWPCSRLDAALKNVEQRPTAATLASFAVPSSPMASDGSAGGEAGAGGDDSEGASMCAICLVRGASSLPPPPPAMPPLCIGVHRSRWRVGGLRGGGGGAAGAALPAHLPWRMSADMAALACELPCLPWVIGVALTVGRGSLERAGWSGRCVCVFECCLL